MIDSQLTGLGLPSTGKLSGLVLTSDREMQVYLSQLSEGETAIFLQFLRNEAVQSYLISKDEERVFQAYAADKENRLILALAPIGGKLHVVAETKAFIGWKSFPININWRESTPSLFQDSEAIRGSIEEVMDTDFPFEELNALTNHELWRPSWVKGGKDPIICSRINRIYATMSVSRVNGSLLAHKGYCRKNSNVNLGVATIGALVLNHPKYIQVWGIEDFTVESSSPLAQRILDNCTGLRYGFN